jgi:hypothetical protein
LSDHHHQRDNGEDAMQHGLAPFFAIWNGPL